MSSVSGTIGAWNLEFKAAPRGSEGEIEVRAGSGSGDAAQWRSVRWKMDDHGIWIEMSDQVIGYDLEAERDEDGQLRYGLLQRGGAGEHSGLALKRAGEAETASAQGTKKALRVRSQMPGKIVRVQVQAGDSVRKGDPLLVMEAMKMENEIRAVYPGVVKTIHVAAGQAVETGADLILMEGS